MQYRLDSLDRVSEVDDEWLPFAAENEAPFLTPDAVLGHSLYSFISDPTTAHLWQQLLARVRDGGLVDLNMRCDSPTRTRLIRVRVLAERQGGVAFFTDVLRIEHRAAVPVPPAGSTGGALTLCSWCQRVRMPTSEWVELEEGIVRLELFERESPGLISHGVCPDCYSRALSEFSVQSPAGPELAQCIFRLPTELTISARDHRTRGVTRSDRRLGFLRDRETGKPMTISRSLRIRAAAFTLVGLAGFILSSADPVLRVPGVLMACLFFLLAGTTLSNASQIARALRPFVGKSVGVEVRGRPLPVPGETAFRIDSISAFGAGLLIRLAPASGSPRRLLKVAQPGPATVRDDRAEIRGAAYVSWAGAKLGPGTGDGAPTLVLLVAGEIRGAPPA